MKFDLQLLFLSALIFASAAAQAISPPQTTNELVTACSGNDPVNFGFCTGYVLAGIEAAGNNSVIESGRTGQRRVLCIPDEWTVGQGIKILQKWAADHPEKLHEPMMSGLLQSNYAAFKCK